MIYLLGSIFFASLIFIVFKLFGKYRINNFPAIIINYFTAGGFGFFIMGDSFHFSDLWDKEWLPYAIAIGFGFIFIFNLMAITTQKLGASAASVTVKMSVAIPVVAAFFIYGDELSFLKITGIILALMGIYCSTKKEKTKNQKNSWLLLLPVILFIGGGTLDSILKYVEESFIGNDSRSIMLLTACIFISAAIFGLLIFLIRGSITKKDHSVGRKEIFWGIALGFINYGSIFCLFSTLNYKDWESSMVFPINNVGIVIFTSLASVLLFQEKLSKINKYGIVFSVIAILLIAIS